MEKTIFDKAGKQLPYTLPGDFDASRLMANAICQEQKLQKKHAIIRKMMWFGSSAAAAAVALLIVFAKPTTATADPIGDYHTALSQYCNTATTAEMENRTDMAESDYVANMDHYEEYFFN